MSEEKKIRIVIASVLKPVNDTRMFEKIALSLHSTQQYEVHVIGFPTAKEFKSEVAIHSLPYFNRLSFKRILAPWRILRTIIILKPSILIITTHELLFISVIAKLTTRCRLIYDVQENYFLNIFYSRSFPPLIRHALAVYVRLKETIASLMVDHFLLAEKGYEHELGFGKHKRTVIENKLKRPEQHFSRLIKNEKTILLFSGTLAESTGVFTAVELATKLHLQNASINLTIIGFCAKHDTYLELKKITEVHPFIHLIGGDHLVPHNLILQHIQQSDFGIVAYQPNPATATSTPTKLYEYLGLKLPILLTDYKPWVELCKPFNAAVLFNPLEIKAEILHQEMISSQFYTSNPDQVFWDSEESKLLEAISLNT